LPHTTTTTTEFLKRNVSVAVCETHRTRVSAPPSVPVTGLRVRPKYYYYYRYYYHYCYYYRTQTFYRSGEFYFVFFFQLRNFTLDRLLSSSKVYTAPALVVRSGPLAVAPILFRRIVKRSERRRAVGKFRRAHVARTGVIVRDRGGPAAGRQHGRVF
jgi:hypothetical protein